MNRTGKCTIINLGLVWHTDNAGNLGLGALTQGHLALLDRAGERSRVNLRKVVFQGRQPGCRYVSGLDGSVGLTNVYLLSPCGFLRDIKKLDAIIDIGDGDGFTTLYGSKRLLRQLGTKLLARLAGVPYVIAPQTIGVFEGKFARRLAKTAVGGAAHVVVRDGASAEAISEMFPGRLPLVTTDVAFAMPAKPAKLPRTEKLRVGINISGLLANRRSSEYRIAFDYNYCALMAAVTKEFLADERWEVHLIGHVFSDDPIDDDGRVLEQWASRFAGIVAAPRFTTPEEAKGYIGAMDVVIASRMHACIAALGTGTPVIAVSYSDKFEGLFSTLNYPWIVPHSGMREKEALALIRSGLADLALMRREATSAQAEAERRLLIYENFLSSLLTSLVAQKSVSR